MDSSRAIDTGGVRRHVYTMAYSDLIHNKHIKLFDGPANHARPYSSAETRGSGIFKALGMMVGHSSMQDGVFPFFLRYVTGTWPWGRRRHYVFLASMTLVKIVTL